MKLLLETTIKSKSEMHDFGTELAKLFSLSDLITFDGDLGVGKTFLCKSIINYLTKINEVVSPTFNIVQTYPILDDEEMLKGYLTDYFTLYEEREFKNNMPKDLKESIQNMGGVDVVVDEGEFE